MEKMILVLLLVLCASVHGIPAAVEQVECDNSTLEVELLHSSDMAPVAGHIDVGIPFDVFWNFFQNPSWWMYWNKFWTFVNNTDFEKCADLNHGPLIPDLSFNITWPKNLQVSPTLIVDLDVHVDRRQVTLAWTYLFTANGQVLVFGRHGNLLQNGSTASSTRFASWEKAFGPYVKNYSDQWTNNLGGALQISLKGVSCLETVYQQNNQLTVALVEAACSSSKF